jgi:hypothetical protein
LEWKFWFFKRVREECYQESNKLTLWNVNALSSAHTFWYMESKAKDKISTVNQFLGRPTITELHIARSKVLELEKHFGTMTREAKVLKNICNADAVVTVDKLLRNYHIKLNTVKRKMNNLEATLKDKELAEEKQKVRDEIMLNHSSEIEERLRKVINIYSNYLGVINYCRLLV